MLNSRTTIIKKDHKKRKYNKINQINKNYLSLMTSSKSSCSLSQQVTIRTNNTDAILFEKQQQKNYYLVDHSRQKPLVRSLTKLPNHNNNHHYQTINQLHKQRSSFISTPRSNSLNYIANTKLIPQVQEKVVYCKNFIVNPRSTTTTRDNHCVKRRRNSPKETYKNKMTIMFNMENNIYYLSALLLALCTLSLTSFGLVKADAQLLQQVQKLKVSPDIIHIPSYIGTIRVELYNNPIKPGDSVPARNFKDLNMAKITWDVSNYDARHTLLLLDLDRKAGANNTQNIYNQFTSLNIPGNLINAGQNIVAFEPPSVPCQPSTKHRILMLAFHQDQNIDIPDIAYMAASSGDSTRRENFKLQNFITRHRLELVAANVFSATGETNGICSSSSTIHHSIQSVSSILIAMVIAITAYGFSSTRQSLVAN